jgi:hypothetical protein
MTKKEWTIIGVLGTAVVIVFCFGSVLLFANLTLSQKQVVVVEVSATPAPTNANALRATSTPQLIRPPAPTDTPKPASKNDADIFVKEHNCISNNENVACLVVFNNPTDSIVDCGFSLTFFDREGVSIGKSPGYAGGLFPGETRKTIETFSLPTNTTFGKYAFSVYRTTRLMGYPGISQNPFSVSGVEIQSPYVVAIVANSSNKSLLYTQVDFILYDKNGRFVGGTQSLPDILPGGKTRVEGFVLHSFGEASRVEVYPSIGIGTFIK